MSKPVCAIFIMPRESSAWTSAEGLWVTARGWAKAALPHYDKLYFVSRDKITNLQGAQNYPVGSFKVEKSTGGLKKLIPSFFKLLLKDLMLWKRSREWSILDNPPWGNEKVAYIWEQHDMFPGPGSKLANELNAPLVSFVHAPNIWEAEKWGVKRYLWGLWVQRYQEIKNLKKADRVACVSESVRQKLVELGLEADKVLVTPMSIDPDDFQPEPNEVLRQELGLPGKKVVGWIGTFRDFHGVDTIIFALKKLRTQFTNLALLFVGEGQVFEETKILVKEEGLSDYVVFTGRVANKEISRYISLFDIALVSARTSKNFHYSPHKLREYMAMGVASIAPDAGEIPNIFNEGEHIVLYKAGDIESLSEAIASLLQDDTKRNKMARYGKQFVLDTSTWGVQFEKVIESLNA
ncbi:MAG: glycosyltransferase family 4 protein [Bacteroidota bacterium]